MFAKNDAYLFRLFLLIFFYMFRPCRFSNWLFARINKMLFVLCIVKVEEKYKILFNKCNTFLRPQEGLNHVFYKWILFYRVFNILQVAFYRFKKFKLFFEIWPVKVGLYNRYLIGRENENGEKSQFHLKSISFFIFKQSCSNFQEMFFTL